MTRSYNERVAGSRRQGQGLLRLKQSDYHVDSRTILNALEFESTAGNPKTVRLTSYNFLGGAPPVFGRGEASSRQMAKVHG
jgi:hypothetical protein